MNSPNDTADRKVLAASFTDHTGQSRTLQVEANWRKCRGIITLDGMYLSSIAKEEGTSLMAMNSTVSRRSFKGRICSLTVQPECPQRHGPGVDVNRGHSLCQYRQGVQSGSAGCHHVARVSSSRFELQIDASRQSRAGVKSAEDLCYTLYQYMYWRRATYTLLPLPMSVCQSPPLDALPIFMMTSRDSGPSRHP